MDSFLLKIFESLKTPGLFLAIVYLIFKKKPISIMKSSEVEQLFFSHEKRLFYKIYNWFIIFLLSLFVITFFSFLALDYLDYNFFVSTFMDDIIFYSFFLMFGLLSITIHLLKKSKIVIRIKQKINNSNFLLGFIILIYFIAINLFLAYICISNVIAKSQAYVEILVLLSCILYSLFIPNIMITLLRPLIIRHNTHYYIIENGVKLYLIKPLNDTEFIIGDKNDENQCIVLRFINLDELKKYEIRIERTLLL